MTYIVTPENPLGEYVTIFLGWAADEEIRRRRVGSGGAVTSFLIYLLDEGVVDGVLVAKKVKGLTGRPELATSKEDVLRAAGNKWDVVPYTQKLRESIADPSIRKVGFVGLPCQAQFLAQMRVMPLMEEDFTEKIEIIISLFCLGTFATEAFLSYLRREHDIKPEDVESVALIENKIVVTADGKKVEIPAEKTYPLMQFGCLVCPDYTGVFSDMSAGISENHLGKTVLIVRNERTREMLEDAARKGYLRLQEAPPDVIEELGMKARVKIMRSIKYLSMVF